MGLGLGSGLGFSSGREAPKAPSSVETACVKMAAASVSWCCSRRPRASEARSRATPGSSTRALVRGRGRRRGRVWVWVWARVRRLGLWSES